MKAVAFDLGDTLVEYEGVPLSWEAHYQAALGNLAAHLRVTPFASKFDAAGAILRRYNTRIHPRDAEVRFASILEELVRVLGSNAPVDELDCATAFFRIFRQKLRCFPETREALATIRTNGMKIGVFTDVPYGMPRELVVEDIRTTGIDKLVDVLITSRDVGFRKPHAATLSTLARALSCDPAKMVYVGNEKKDVEAAQRCGCRSILIDRENRGIDYGQDRTIRTLQDL